jgi:hypothetical protein
MDGGQRQTNPIEKSDHQKRKWICLFSYYLLLEKVLNN